MKSWVQRLQASLQQITPGEAALLLSVGLVLGVFPIVGVPTLLCLAAAAGLRLNAAVLQVLNNVTSPLQLALLFPLERAGAWLCRALPSGVTSAAGSIGMAAVYAVVGWAIICVPAGALLYLVLASGNYRPLREVRRFLVHR